ncbi:MAG: ABC transporter permease [Reichenbachiella sp.]|uniref:ABC transporter permease n=1 Tax=Reichenbachiella sp. TaxID=2184521 RepID=UPI003267648B
MGLYKSHITVAFRSMKKYKFYATVNILGLALAISFVFLSYLFIQNELSFDQFHSKKDRTYRLYGYAMDPDSRAIIDGDYNGCTPIPLAEDLAEHIPNLEYYTRLGSVGGTVLKNNIPYDEVIAMADSGFFEMFDFPIVHGGKNALGAPASIVLSEQKAAKYFEMLNPVGQSLELILGDSAVTFLVAAVVDNKKNNSSLPFDFLIPFERMKMVTSYETYNSYDVSFTETWVTFDEPQSLDVSDMLSKVIGDKMDVHSGKGMVGIQPLTDVHYDSQIQGMYPAANPKKAWILGGLSVIVLIIALMNFVTLSIGHSLHRVKEIGLRKIFGGGRSSLKAQLMLESLMISIISSVISLALTFYFLPAFNSLIEGALDHAILVSHLGFMVLLIFLISAVTGMIQAFVLVSFKPISVLKGPVLFTKKGSLATQGVVVFQFTMAVLLVIGTLVIHQQMNFIQSKDLGFDQNRLIEITLHTSERPELAKRSIQRYKTLIAENPIILSAGASMNGFREPWTQLSFKQDDESLRDYFFNQVDEDYLKTMNMGIVLGEAFNTAGSILPTNIIVNESLVKKMGWENPLDEQIPGQGFSRPHRIIGVVKDFHYGSLHEEIKPLILATDPVAIQSGIFGISTYVWPPNLYTMVIRLGPGDLIDAVDYLEHSWEKTHPHKPFTFNFVDEMLASKYADEVRWRKVTNIASAFAIIVAWLGLLGLSRLSVQRRVKEIGIRKVLGSSVFGITQKLSTHYLMLVGIASMLAWPIGWWMANHWLDSFTYRINISATVFGLSSLAVLLITICSVGFQGYKAALANPIDVLRTE